MFKPFEIKLFGEIKSQTTTNVFQLAVKILNSVLYTGQEGHVKDKTFVMYTVHNNTIYQPTVFEFLVFTSP